VASVERLAASAAYRLVRRRLSDMLRAAPPAAAAAPVPSCPEWTVEDVLAHLAAIAVNWAAAESGVPPAGVSRGSGLAVLLDQWEEAASRLDRLLAGRGGMERMLMDAVTHEYDLRVALRLGWPAGDPVLPVTLDFLGPAFSWTVASRGLPPLRVATAEGSWLVGDGAAEVVSGEPVEVMRSLTGRRTLAQVAALDWSADPGTWLPAFTWGPFRPPSQPVE
jgi:uncharacterized protein (TIGR03083 family)